MGPQRQGADIKSHIHEAERRPVNLPEEDALAVLNEGEVVGGYRVASGSNYTFMVHLDAGPGEYLPAIYKPRDGERPLWDFPNGSLYKRECAAFLVSQQLGWPRVPPTVVRDGPYGVGSMQLFANSDDGQSYFDLIETHKDELAPFAAFDVLANNADRKAGHCLLGIDGTIRSIDHGLTFHEDFKLRTVMLEFWGTEVPAHLVDDMKNLLDGLDAPSEFSTGLTELLSQSEIDALRERLERLIAEPLIPVLDPRFNVPWPLV